jgi:hypothetical protein
MHDERGHSFGGGRTIPISQPQRPPGQRRAELLGANYDNAHPKAERWQPNTSAKIRVAPRSKIGPVDCRFGSKAATARSNRDVGFTPESCRGCRRPVRQLRASFGHSRSMHICPRHRLDRLLNQRQSRIICVATPRRSGATTCGWGNPCRSRGALPGLATSAPEQPMLCAPIVSHTCAATMQISDGDTFNSSATM